MRTWNDGSATHTYTYDAEGRLVSVDSGGIQYTYDAFGRRVEKTINGGKYDYVYDLAGNKVAMIDASNGSWMQGDVWAGGRHLAVYAGSTTQFSHGDWMGTERVHTDVSGNVAGSCTSNPYGDNLNCTGSNNSTIGFAGMEYDWETGFYHTQFRYYNPKLGSWMTPDPSGMAAADLSDPQSLNRYAYSLNNPTNYRDPLGLWPTDVHNTILENAFPGLSDSQMRALQQASGDMDELQGDVNANVHGQCTSEQKGDLEACSAGIMGQISGGIERASASGFNMLGLYELGEALHTLADLTSPWHSDDNGTPTCWRCSDMADAVHFLEEDVFPLAMNHYMMGRLAQAVLNVQAGFLMAFPNQYANAVSGFQMHAFNSTYNSVLMSTGSVSLSFSSSILLNEGFLCALGNSAACTDEGDGAFMQLIAGGGGSNEIVCGAARCFPRK